MAPSKVEVADVERRKGEGKGEDQGVLGLASSMTHLTLHPHTSTDLVAELEADLAKVTLQDPHRQEEIVEEETEKGETSPGEEERQRDNTEVTHEKESESVAKEGQVLLPESETDQEKEEKEDDEEKEGTEEEEEEEEEKEKDGHIGKVKKEEEEEAVKVTEEEAVKVTEEEAVKVTEEEVVKVTEEEAVKVTEEEAVKVTEEEAVKVTEEEEKQVDKEEEEKEEEEAVSDDENPPDSAEKGEAKECTLRSRGHGRGTGHGYMPSAHLGFPAFQQQQQQQQQPPLGSFYPGGDGESSQGLWESLDSSQHVYEDVNNGYYPSPEYQGSAYSQYQGSPTSQYQGLSTSQYQGLPPSQYQGFPVSQYQGLPSSQYQASPSSRYQASPNSQYQGSRNSQFQASPNSQFQASPNSQFQASPNSQYQGSPSSQYQGSPSSQYQGSPSSQYLGSPSSQYQASPSSQYQGSPSSQYQGSPSSQYQGSPSSQYQGSPSSQYQPCSPFYPNDSLFQNTNTPSEFQEGALQEDLVPSTDTTTTTTSLPITPPYSPIQPTGEDVLEVLDFFVDVKKCSCEVLQDHSDSRIHKDESKIIEIARMLMDISNSDNLEDQLDQEKYIQFYKWCSAMDNEDLVAEDEDGDIKIMVAAGQGQLDEGYNERLVAMTKRTEAINLCCDTLVDWRVNGCQKCGNIDPKNFYSPLSWKNKHGEMLLSNAVLMRYPGHVVGYLTKKVMQRPIDLRRTFDQHYNLFVDAQKFYPCLTEALRRLEQV